MSEGERLQVVARLPAEMVNQLRAESRRTGVTMQAIIEQAIVARWQVQGYVLAAHTKAPIAPEDPDA